MVLQGTIDSIDWTKRIVSIKGSDGRIAAMVVGPDIRDFQNLKVGDQVRATFTEATALALVKGGDDIRQRVHADAARQGPAGDKPGMQAMERTTIVANVWNIDRDSGKVTLRSPDGRMIDLRVQDKQVLQNLSKQDQVVASFTESVAVSIVPGAAAQPSSGGSSGTAARGK